MSDPGSNADLGIVLETNDPERAWNAFRLGITALNAGHSVSVFLLGAGVEAEEITENEQFDVRDRMELFADEGGKLLACGTCLEMRQSDESEVCPISTMDDLLNVVMASDRVITIG